MTKPNVVVVQITQIVQYVTRAPRSAGRLRFNSAARAVAELLGVLAIYIGGTTLAYVAAGHPNTDAAVVLVMQMTTMVIPFQVACPFISRRVAAKYTRMRASELQLVMMVGFFSLLITANICYAFT